MPEISTSCWANAQVILFCTVGTYLKLACFAVILEIGPTLICPLVYTILLLVSVCDSHENDKTDVEIRWRRLADKVFKSSTRVDKTQADMSFELMRKDFEAMRELLSNDEDGKESIPDWEVEQVKFWVQSAEFNGSQCKVEHEKLICRMADRYCIPNLLMFKDVLINKLQDYCLIKMDELLKPLHEIPERNLSLLAWIGDEGNVDFEKAADVLAPYVPAPKKTKSKYDDKFPDIHRQINEAFERALKGPCERVVAVPLETQRTIIYFKYKEHVSSINPKVSSGWRPKRFAT